MALTLRRAAGDPGGAGGAGIISQRWMNVADSERQENRSGSETKGSGDGKDFPMFRGVYNSSRVKGTPTYSGTLLGTFYT